MNEVSKTRDDVNDASPHQSSEKIQPLAQCPHVVIVGAGFGGLAAAQQLAQVAVRVTVLDQYNYHLFQPLLYQVATAGLSPANIAWPVRYILKRQKNARIIMARVTGMNLATKSLILKNHADIPYDYLVLATGARHSYFGRDEWAKYAPGIKTVADATMLRQKILLAFEKAEMEEDAEERKRLLTFIIIGGGPTGVEMAGAIAELARHSIVHDFQSIVPASARIILIEAGTRILASFHEKLSCHAKKALEKSGVEVMTNVRVEHLDQNGILTRDHKIESRNVIWAAGVKASDAGKWLGVGTDHNGRVLVNQSLNIASEDPLYKDIFVIGDTAAYVPQGKQYPLPGVAPVAKQMGCYAARTITARIRGEKGDQPFVYKDMGSMAMIGRNHAVADFKIAYCKKRMRMSGFFGWWIWSIAHVYFLIGLRNRFAVAMNWLWQYITRQRGARLITAEDQSRL